ncbi:hypothetical protein QJQ45_013222 [Haematococcus lacustris]|nr:hypothetical protein QJQ45_013222 [Haematococcus lacustris]
MKLTGIGILKWNGQETAPIFLGSAIDVSNFGYFQRPAVREGIMFIARTIVQRTSPGQRQTVKNAEYFCHVYVTAETGLAAIVVADSEYPTTAAFSIISKVLEEFTGQAKDTWRAVEADSQMAGPLLEPALVKYQDHTQADKIARIQKDLDETKIILHQTIDSVLRRGEKLDALVDKSNDLSLASQMFYKQARKTNSCYAAMEQAVKAGTPVHVLEQAKSNDFLLLCLRKAKLGDDLLQDVADACELNELNALSLSGLTSAEAANSLFLMEGEAVTLLETCKRQCLRIGVCFGDGSVYEANTDPADEDVPTAAVPPPASPEPSAGTRQLVSKPAADAEKPAATLIAKHTKPLRPQSASAAPVPSYARHTAAFKAAVHTRMAHEAGEDAAEATAVALGMPPSSTTQSISPPKKYTTLLKSHSARLTLKDTGAVAADEAKVPKKSVFAHISASLLRPTKAFLAWTTPAAGGKAAEQAGMKLNGSVRLQEQDLQRTFKARPMPKFMTPAVKKEPIASGGHSPAASAPPGSVQHGPASAVTEGSLGTAGCSKGHELTPESRALSAMQRYQRAQEAVARKRWELQATNLDKTHLADLIEEADKHRRLLGIKKQGSLQDTLQSAQERSGQLVADQLARWKLTKGQVKHASGLNNSRCDTQRWLAPIKPHLQHLAAASSAGTSLEADLKHVTDQALEQFFKQLEKDMAEVSMERHGRAKQLVVFFGAAGIGTRAPTGPMQQPGSHTASTEPGPSTPPPAKRSKRTEAEPPAEPNKGTGKGKGKAA